VTLWRNASLPARFEGLISPAFQRVDRFLSSLTAVSSSRRGGSASKTGDLLFNTILAVTVGALAILAVRFILTGVGLTEVGYATLLGLATGARVTVLLVFSTLVWTPVGVAIGFSPKLARVSQPFVQILASFPANFVFPFATLLLIRLGVSLNWGSMLLMAMGAQWYLLFNVIGGAQAIPNDLREMARSIGLRGAKSWKALIGPGIFGSWVTGSITASGGAWNASIVAEIVSWGTTTLRAKGLGSYISDATGKGDWPRIVLGVGLMSIFVVGINRLVWRPLYGLAETKYRLG